MQPVGKRILAQNIYSTPHEPRVAGGDQFEWSAQPEFKSLGPGNVGQTLQSTPQAPFRKYLRDVGLDAGATRVRHVALAHTSLTPVGAGAVQLAAATMSPIEMVSTNAGYYHSVAHPLNVAGAIGEVATSLGRSPERVHFLQQVALLHDVDERLDPRHLEQGATPGTQARVQVTLQWMNANRDALEKRLGWTGPQFLEASCLIARTDFPFDREPRDYGTVYDGQSPVDVYRTLLLALPPDRRTQVMEDGVALSFADEVGNYLGTREQARDAVYGLSREMGVDRNELISTSAEFQREVGAHTEFDTELASELGVNVTLPTRSRLEAALSTVSRGHLFDNRAFFEELSG